MQKIELCDLYHEYQVTKFANENFKEDEYIFYQYRDRFQLSYHMSSNLVITISNYGTIIGTQTNTFFCDPNTFTELSRHISDVKLTPQAIKLIMNILNLIEGNYNKLEQPSYNDFIVYNKQIFDKIHGIIENIRSINKN